MTLQKKDFVEIEFTGKIADTGEIFDSNIKEDLEKITTQKVQPRPFVFALGEGMFLPAVDDFLVGKPAHPAEYEISLKPEQAFGKRDSKMIQMIPMKFFKIHNVAPTPGAMLNFDGKIGKVLTASSGRVVVDFNNPIAGKEVVYKIKVLKKIEDLNEKVKALNEFLFRKEFLFEIKENKIIMEVEKSFVKFVEMFKDKFNELIGLGLEVKEVASQADEILPTADAVSEKINEKVQEKIERFDSNLA